MKSHEDNKQNDSITRLTHPPRGEESYNALNKAYTPKQPLQLAFEVTNLPHIFFKTLKIRQKLFLLKQFCLSKQLKIH